jgi:hypothetical protein
MATPTEIQRNRVSLKVREYIDKYPQLLPDDCWGVLDIERIIQTGTDILLSKWNIMHDGGNFVDAVCSNDLRGAVSYADKLHKSALVFFVILYDNMGYIK